MNRRSRLLESLAAHGVVLLFVAFALYPVLWVIALAFSGSQAPEPHVLPVAANPTLGHLQAVVGATKGSGDASTWLFGRQVANSVAVAVATALAGVSIAIPTAYALARFDFVGKASGLRALLATQSPFQKEYPSPTGIVKFIQ